VGVTVILLVRGIVMVMLAVMMVRLGARLHR
jgi:hypothetical protein